MDRFSIRICGAATPCAGSVTEASAGIHTGFVTDTLDCVTATFAAGLQAALLLEATVTRAAVTRIAAEFGLVSFSAIARTGAPG